MAKPQDSYPETATNGARKQRPDVDGEVALREALERHGEDLAAAVESTDELDGVLTTAILIAASADEDDVDRITQSAAALVEAADGLATPEAADLAAAVGEDADDLSSSLDTVIGLQREGHLDDLVTLATAFSESLSDSEVEELAATLEANGSDLVDALDVVLDLQREGHLDDLVDLAKALSVLDVDRETAEGLNALLSSVGDAQRARSGSGPPSVLGLARGFSSADARAGVGYLIALVKALGQRVRAR